MRATRRRGRCAAFAKGDSLAVRPPAGMEAGGAPPVVARPLQRLIAK